MEGSINSEGLPNKGIDYYITEELVAAVKGSHEYFSASGPDDKPVR